MSIPKMFKLRMNFDCPQVTDIAAAVDRELAKLPLDRISGKSVAVTVGSRGIANLPVIVKAICATLKKAGGLPFVVPTMGSHGGGTAAGQKAVLRDYGITSDSIGCPIRGDMETRVIGVDNGTPIYWSELLIDADFVLVFGRVKAHTGFTGGIESGLCKMLAIGGGRYRGAQQVHRRAQTVGMEAAIRRVVKAVFAHNRIRLLGGLAVRENQLKQTAAIDAVLADAMDSFIAHEERLLAESLGWLGQFPFRQIGVLHLHEMGKNVSGSGNDPNVIGRKLDGWRLRELLRSNQAQIGLVCCSTLTEVSHGNATGLAFHDGGVCRRLMESIDWEVTRRNAETGWALDSVEKPPVFADDQAMLRALLPRVPARLDGPQLVCAKNSVELGAMWVSEDGLAYVKDRSDLEVVTRPQPITFRKGYLELGYGS